MRRRSSLLAIAACSCNWVYGLGDVHPVDASFYDASAPMCPPIGDLPRFDHADLRVALPQDCTFYTRSAGNVRALATCVGVIYQGLPDGPLAPVTELATTSAWIYSYPRISEDGMFATVQRVALPSDASEVVMMHHDTSGWVPVSTIGDYSTFSEPTSAPPAHVLAASAMDLVHELVDDGNGGWTEIRSFAVPFAGQLHLSPDGLRMWFSNVTGSQPVEYYDRPSLDDVFVKRGVIAESDGFQAAFLSADCGRLYFTTLDRIWFAHQPYR